MVKNIRVSVPGYLLVAAEIRRRITSGEFAAGAKLPTQEGLAREFRVSVSVVRRALDVLRQEGRVRSEPGSRSTYVAEEGPQALRAELAQARDRLQAAEAQLVRLRSVLAQSSSGRRRPGRSRAVLAARWAWSRLGQRRVMEGSLPARSWVGGALRTLRARGMA
ncbi:winged helix-turn-helix domain-containing protein [Streptomyces sp. NPDC001941]|uniref:winged helix-turn-helix domain-containing protein n=1 Tax=Streptomyces sp. NPDC001941 TaxID=3154659 RepID=UPI0033237C68